MEGHVQGVDMNMRHFAGCRVRTLMCACIIHFPRVCSQSGVVCTAAYFHVQHSTPGCPCRVGLPCAQRTTISGAGGATTAASASPAYADTA